VQQLERGADASGGLEVGAAERLVGGEDHARAEALAAGGVGLELLPELLVLGSQGGRTLLG
jgi:hypothetical protein